MCGRYNVTDSPEVQQLMEIIGMPIPGAPRHFRFATDISPASPISIVRQTDHGLEIADAIWWLMLDPATGKPTKYTSFNSRSDKLNTPRSLAYQPYRQTRCIIPASAFIEGLGDGKTYHKIELQGQAIAFGGLYREWLNKETGEIVIGASIITLGPLPEWKDIHPDSMPLMLPIDQPDVLRAWLNPEVSDVQRFEPLLVPQIRVPQLVTPIDRPSKWNATGPARIIGQ